MSRRRVLAHDDSVRRPLDARQLAVRLNASTENVDSQLCYSNVVDLMFLFYSVVRTFNFKFIILIKDD